MKKTKTKLAIVALITLFILAFAGWLFVKFFGYSTPIPSSTPQEQSFYEKSEREWNARKEQEQKIK